MHTATVLIGVFGAAILVLLVLGIVTGSRAKGGAPQSSDSGYIPGVTDGTLGAGKDHPHDGGGHHGDSGSHSGGHGGFDGGHGGFSDGGGGSAHSAH